MQARVGPRGLGGGLGLLPGPRPVGVWSQEPLVFSQLIFQLRLPGSPEPHWAQERPGSAPVGEGRHIGCAPPPPRHFVLGWGGESPVCGLQSFLPPWLTEVAPAHLWAPTSTHLATVTEAPLRLGGFSPQ